MNWGLVITCAYVTHVVSVSEYVMARNPVIKTSMACLETAVQEMEYSRGVRHSFKNCFQNQQRNFQCNHIVLISRRVAVAVFRSSIVTVLSRHAHEFYFHPGMHILR
jgi:hypothetical protein